MAVCAFGRVRKFAELNAVAASATAAIVLVSTVKKLKNRKMSQSAVSPFVAA